MRTITITVLLGIGLTVAVLRGGEEKKGGWEGWSCVFSNGVDHPVAVVRDVGGKVERWEVMGTNTVREIMASGEVCKISGHCWRDGRPGEGNGSYYADWHPTTIFRTCQVCGKCQTQDTSWK